MRLVGNKAFMAGLSLGVTAGFGIAHEIKIPDEVVVYAPADDKIVGEFVVSRVVDGDTFDVEVPDSAEPKRVRVIGLDTPEVNPGECFGREASAEAKRLLMNQTVNIQVDPATDKTTDDFGRLLRTAEIVDRRGEQDLTRLMISRGFAAAFRTYEATDKPTLLKLEAKARAGNVGLWGVCAMPASTITPDMKTNVNFPPADAKKSVTR